VSKTININDLKIPLIIGVTGHRDIAEEDKEKLEEKISDIFEYILYKYKNTPIILLTPLADGADRIVAKVALNEKFRDKITISVPLPFDEQTYQTTFGVTVKKEGKYLEELVVITQEGSINEYDSFIDRIDNQINTFVPTKIPMLFDKDEYDKLDEEEKKAVRYKQYSLVGEYVAIHSHILIALQNPCSEGKNGGTAEIVNKKLSGEYEYINTTRENVNIPERGIVYRILTPRKKDEHELVNKYQVIKLFPGNKQVEFKNKDEEPKFLKSMLYKVIDFYTHLLSKPCITKTEIESMNSFRLEHYRINCFNKLVKEHEKIEEPKKKIIKLSEDNVVSYREKGIISDECCWDSDEKLLVKNIITRRAAATLSNIYQNKMNSLELPILILIMLSVSTFFIPDILPESFDKYIKLSYIFIIALFYIFYVYFKKYKDTYEDTRAISEGLRVQIAWKMSKINDSVALSYPSSHKDQMGWIRTTLRALNIFSIPKKQLKVNNKEKEKINKHWINEQIEYFEKNINKLSMKKKSQDKKINFFIYTSIFFSFIFSLNSIFSYIDSSSIWFSLTKFFLIGVPVILLAYFKAKQAFDSYGKTIAQYELSLAHFQRAKNLLQDENNDSMKIYKSLGIEALGENTFWTILRREKQYKSPSL